MKPGKDPAELGRAMADLFEAMEAAYRLGGVQGAVTAYNAQEPDLLALAKRLGMNDYDAPLMLKSRARAQVRRLRDGGLDG